MHVFKCLHTFHTNMVDHGLIFYFQPFTLQAVLSCHDKDSGDQTLTSQSSTSILEQSSFDADDSFVEHESSQEIFPHVARITTLAETFGLTSFKPFQTQMIDATLSGKDCL